MRCAERRQQAAPDHDVVARSPSATSTDDRLAGCAAARSWRAPPSRPPESAPRRSSCSASAATISSTMVSCGTSRDMHRHVGLGIDRVALGHQRASVCGRIAGLQQRPVGCAALDPAHQHVEIGLEPDRDALRARSAARVSAFMKAPPPVASTCGPPSSSRAITRASPARKYGSPWRRENLRDGHAGARPRSRRRHRRTGCRAAAPAGGRSTTCRRPSCRRARSSGVPSAATTRLAGAPRRRHVLRSSLGRIRVWPRCLRFTADIPRHARPLASSRRTWWSAACQRRRTVVAVVIDDPCGRHPEGRGPPRVATCRACSVSDRRRMIGGVAYGAMFALANFVEPKPREMTVTIPPRRSSSSSTEPSAASWRARHRSDTIADRAVPRHAGGRARRRRATRLTAYRRDLDDFAGYLASAPHDRRGDERRRARLSRRARAGAASRRHRWRGGSRRSASSIASSMPKGSARDDPAAVIEGPKRGRPLPKVLSVSPRSTDCSARTRARRRPSSRSRSACAPRASTCLLEVLYATGLRVSELVTLPASAARRDERMLIVRGKGGKERLVPLNDAAKTRDARISRAAREAPRRARRKGASRSGCFRHSARAVI